MNTLGLTLGDLFIPKKEVSVKYRALWKSEIETRAIQIAGRTNINSVIKTESSLLDDSKGDPKNLMAGIGYLTNDQSDTSSFSNRVLNNLYHKKHDAEFLQHCSFQFVKLLNITWNVAGLVPNDHSKIKKLLPDFGPDSPDVIVISLQEIFELNVAHFGKILINESSKEVNNWQNALNQILNPTGKGYQMVDIGNLVATLQFIFAKPELVPHIKVTRKNITKLGTMGILGNKGAVTTTLRVYDSVFKFCACHCAAGSSEKDLESRIENMNLIINEDFNNKFKREEDFWFILGDLNFRVCAKRDFVIGQIDQVRDQLKNANAANANSVLLSILEKDELLNCMKLGYFEPFKESFVEF